MSDIGIGGSIVVAAITAAITSALTRGRDRDADWRKLRFDVYKEYILALSGIVVGRDGPHEHERYADAVNSMQLIAPAAVLNALSSYLKETSERNKNRTEAEHDRLLSDLVSAMRRDVHPSLMIGRINQSFRLQAIPTRILSDATSEG